MPVFAINGKSVLSIHVPKTGGTTVEKVLSQHGPMSLHSNGGCFRDQFRGGAGCPSLSRSSTCTACCCAAWCIPTSSIWSS